MCVCVCVCVRAFVHACVRAGVSGARLTLAHVQLGHLARLLTTDAAAAGTGLVLSGAVDAESNAYTFRYKQVTTPPLTNVFSNM